MPSQCSSIQYTCIQVGILRRHLYYSIISHLATLCLCVCVWLMENGSRKPIVCGEWSNIVYANIDKFRICCVLCVCLPLLFARHICRCVAHTLPYFGCHLKIYSPHEIFVARFRGRAREKRNSDVSPVHVAHHFVVVVAAVLYYCRLADFQLGKNTFRLDSRRAQIGNPHHLHQAYLGFTLADVATAAAAALTLRVTKPKTNYIPNTVN